MHLGDFHPLAPAGREYFGFDFARDLVRIGGGVTIVSAAWNVDVKEAAENGDTDATPADLKDGVPVVSGSKVSQLIDGAEAVLGVRYTFEALATLSDGQVLPLCGDVLIEAC